jgi:hypothetical protein
MAFPLPHVFHRLPGEDLASEGRQAHLSGRWSARDKRPRPAGHLATLTTEAGISGHVIARELGHTSYKTTKEHYTKKGTLERVRNRRMLHFVQGGKAETQKKTCDENREFRHRQVSDQPKP